MKPLLTTLIGVVSLGSPALYADVFPESFETGTLEEKGWTAVSAGRTDCSWSVVTYASQTTQFPKNLQAPDGWGDKVLFGTTKGAGFVASAETPDILVSSPEFSIGNEGWLSFLMACNMVNNGGANVADEAKTRFEVLVSPSGSSDRSAYTDTLYRELSINLNNWKTINADLTLYKGKKVRVAFRMYAHEAALKNLTQNFLYIDGVQLLGSPAPDVALKSVSGLFNGSEKTQYPVVSILNNGSDLQGVDLKISVNGGDPLIERANIILPKGEIVEYKMQTPVVLPAGTNTVTMTAELSGDGCPGNNTASGTVNILETATLPFVLVDGAGCKDQMVSTASGTVRVPDGWQFFTTQNRWIHSVNQKTAYLYPKDAYTLGDGPVRISLDTELTGQEATVGIYLTKNLSDFGQIVDSVKLTQAAPSGFMLLQAPEKGDYVIAFRVLDGAKGEQVVLKGLKIEAAGAGPDVAVRKLILPPSIPTGSGAEVAMEIVNEGSSDTSEIKVAYNCGDLSVEENAGSLEAGKSMTYVFKKSLEAPVGTHPVTVTATAEGDVNKENDMLSGSVTVYNPYALPYKESFEKEADTKLWTLENAGGLPDTWTPLDGYQFDGTHILSLASSTVAHDDWAISPAITIPAGWKGRLSYYYGAGGNFGMSSLKVYLSKESDPAKIAASAALADHATSETNVEYSSVPVEFSEGGTYYIAFHASKGKESLLIDDLRLDATPEIAATGADISVKGVDYDLEPGKVTVKGVNHGLTAVRNIKVGYAVNLTSGDKTRQISTFEEEYKEEVAPGAEFTYVFSKPVDFKEEGIYTIVTAIGSTADTDQKNNTYMTSGPEKLITMQLPVRWDMEYSDYLHGFELGSWKLGAVDPYAGSRSITHSGRPKAEGGDIMVFNRVYLPAGTYDFSFFWKSTQNQTGDTYKQSFDVLIGTGSTLESLTDTLFTFEQALAADKPHKKELVSYTIDKSGYYWIGINSRESGAMGRLTVDEFVIAPREARIKLEKLNDEYKADFVHNAGEWQFYHPNGLVAQQWIPQDGTGDLVLYELNDDITGKFEGSWLQAPAFLLTKDMEYEVKADLEMAPIDASHSLDGTEALVLYGSDVDLPSEFKEIGSLTPEGKPVSFVADASGIRYLTLKARTHGNVKVTLKGFSVQTVKSTGLDAITVPGFGLNGNVLTIPEGVTAQVYTLSGMKLAEFSGSMSLDQGIYIVRFDGKSVKIRVGSK